MIIGNPTAIASLKEAETVIDLGSGGGFDCFLASKKVGPNGKVIGIDMTQNMIDLATINATNKGYKNVEFRLGEIEKLPVATGIADVIISNCVVNLSPEKEKVFQEASRVLKSGGRIAISDVVAIGTMPDSLKNNPDLYTGCMAGAMEIEKLKYIIENSGFSEVEIRIKPESREYIANWAPGTNVEDYVVSADIRAIKL
jgi:arsenite methyltransferase